MSAGIEKGQFGLVYGHKFMMWVAVYFKREIQSNDSVWPNR